MAAVLVPNDPLTREDLLEMDGETVWVLWPGHTSKGEALVRVWLKQYGVIYLTFNNGVVDLVDKRHRGRTDAYSVPAAVPSVYALEQGSRHNR